MATNRKSLSKKIRFEVFKRDKFTCQYCGKSAPDVILEVDHIKPVSKGGSDDLLNLVTSCMDCNRGKSNTELSDDTAVQKQKQQMKELADHKEQLDMMLRWRSGLADLENEQIEVVNNIFRQNTSWTANDHGKKTIKKWIKEFGLSEVMDAVEIAIDTYYDETEDGWNNAFNKVSGICFNKRKQANNPTDYYCNYLVKVASTDFSYCDDRRLRRYLKSVIRREADFEIAKDIIGKSRNWSEMCSRLEDDFGGRV